MTQKIRKKWKSASQLDKLSREDLLARREESRKFREKALRELATNYTLTLEQKVNHLVDYVVGVPLE